MLTYEREHHGLEIKEIPTLLGDMRRMKQVLMNLIKNAMKFTPEGKIEVFANYSKKPENLLTLQIKDSGVGIAA
jgi:signal transduction histidine kinase